MVVRNDARQISKPSDVAERMPEKPGTVRQNAGLSATLDHNFCFGRAAWVCASETIKWHDVFTSEERGVNLQ